MIRQTVSTNKSVMSTLARSADEIVPGVFVGDKDASCDLQLLARLKITHIITAELIPLPRLVTSAFPHMAVLHVNIAGTPLDMTTPWAKTKRLPFLVHSEKRNIFLPGSYHKSYAQGVAG